MFYEISITTSQKITYKFVSKNKDTDELVKCVMKAENCPECAIVSIDIEEMGVYNKYEQHNLK